jgi:hypothetical protein
MRAALTSGIAGWPDDDHLTLISLRFGEILCDLELAGVA